jgi:RNA polymerase primary sigma factor
MPGQIPPDLIERVNKVVRTSRQMLTEIGREPTLEEIADRLSMPLETVRKLRELAGRPLPLEAWGPPHALAATTTVDGFLV